MSQWACWRHDLDAYVGDQEARAGGLRLIARALACGYRHPGFWAVAAYRFGRAARGCRVPVLRPLLLLLYYVLVSPWIRFGLGIELPLTATSGRDLRSGIMAALFLAAGWWRAGVFRSIPG